MKSVQILAMGQFERMIRHDANLRNYVKFNVYHHDNAVNDTAAAIYIVCSGDVNLVSSVTRLNVKSCANQPADLNQVIAGLEARHIASYNNGILVLTAHSINFTNDFVESVEKNPGGAIQLVLNDTAGYDIEYHSFDEPQADKVGLDLNLNSLGNWVGNNNAQMRSYICFSMDDVDYVVLARQYREESFLMLTSFNSAKLIAHFTGMIAGRYISQRVFLEPAKYSGDQIFCDHYKENRDTIQDNQMWRIRHLGLHVNENEEMYIRGPHIAGRNQMVIPDANDYDFTENRIVIL